MGFPINHFAPYNSFFFGMKYSFSQISLTVKIKVQRILRCRLDRDILGFQTRSKVGAVKEKWNMRVRRFKFNQWTRWILMPSTRLFLFLLNLLKLKRGSYSILMYLFLWERSKPCKMVTNKWRVFEVPWNPAFPFFPGKIVHLSFHGWFGATRL